MGYKCFRCHVYARRRSGRTRSGMYAVQWYCPKCGRVIAED